MYLRTIYELEEEGVVPLRARIAERLGQSGPTVSQTTARMERDGLLQVAADRHLELSEKGRRLATSVMRKHRLAERLLHDVIGLEWDQLHIEACRWEHVMSDQVEQRILLMLAEPMLCPHGNPIPGLEDLGRRAEAASALSGDTLLSVAGPAADTEVTVERISEQLQPDDELMRFLKNTGVLPGRRLTVRRSPDGVTVREHRPAGSIPNQPVTAGGPGQTSTPRPGPPDVVIDPFTAEHVFVVPVPAEA